MRNVRRQTVIAGVALALLAAPAATAWQDGSGDRPKRRRGREFSRRGDGLKVGQKAPGFTLKTLDGKKEFDLSGLKGKRPVVVFFGSYT
ncbi:MAG: hypothetical protein V3T70_06175 [Phycisphaerae bacterium]